MRIAALYDMHANLPALEAVLREVRDAEVDHVLVGGDVLPGPMPRETLELLVGLDVPTHFIRGNGDLAVLAQAEASDPSAVTYWGTTSGEPLPEPQREELRWTASKLSAEHRARLARWPKAQELEVDGVGRVLFCHGTPRSETECFTRLTREDRLLEAFEGVTAEIVVCGHTHMQFDRSLGRVRVVNAGSVGMPFGHTGADWLLLGSGVQLRHTEFDLETAARRVRDSGYPQADDSRPGMSWRHHRNQRCSKRSRTLRFREGRVMLDSGRTEMRRAACEARRTQTARSYSAPPYSLAGSRYTV